jgi:polysaccharide deacetylase 2 family uncharacterized protein YibQ
MNGMRPRKAPHGGRLRWGVLMTGAFLAGLLAAGVAIFLPGADDRERFPASSSFAPPSPPPQPLPSPLPQAATPKLAIVVDDLGYEPSLDAEWLKLPGKFTVAVLPFGPSSRKVSESARARGWGVILHVPMEPKTPASDLTERFRIRKGMSVDEIESLLVRMAENIPHATGVSNHMGSAVTADPVTMAAFTSAIVKRGYYLLDSMTTPDSVAVETARKNGIPSARRDFFLDPSGSPDEMRRQWESAVSMAREKGTAILVCHSKVETLRIISELLPLLRKENVEAVTLDEIIRYGKET